MNGRIHWLDAARTLAILTVLLCHCVEGVYSFNLEFLAAVSLKSKLFAIATFTLGRLGVPLFLFLTGYLLLDRTWDDESCIRFWKTRWLPLFLCVETWIVIYNIMLGFTGHPLALKDLVLTMLFLQNVDMGHFWYMPMIVGIYLFLPIMGRALSQLKPRTIAFPLTITALYAFGIPIASQALSAIGSSITLTTHPDYGFIGGVFGIYIILGWCVKNRAFKQVLSHMVAACLAAAFAGCVLFQLWCDEMGRQYSVWYSNGLLLISGLALFELLSRLPNSLFTATNRDSGIEERTILERVCYFFSYYSFALYLVHYPIRTYLLSVIKPMGLSLPLKTFVAFAILLPTSTLMCWLLSKTPRVGKRLLYLK